VITESTGSPHELEAAERQAAEAEQQLRVQQVAARLRQRTGLHYASIGSDPHLGPHLVVHDGAIVGTLRTTSVGALGDWFARALHSSTDLGPYPTARAAAATLLPAVRDQ
jgi:hypothetical protein